VGKSSLLNALLRMNRAIVTPLPGTTRDTLEEVLNLRGVPLILVDTAGLNDQTQDMIEQLGIERSRAAADQADLILWVVDGNQPLTEPDWAMAEWLSQRPALILINKMDLPAVADTRGLIPSAPRVHLSASTGQGLPDLEHLILEVLFKGKVSISDTPLINSIRHKDAVVRALVHVDDAIESQEEGSPVDFMTIDLTSACNALGEITGESVSDDLLQSIFSNFCIGK
jgi:tRNA modification GTPase